MSGHDNATAGTKRFRGEAMATRSALLVALSILSLSCSSKTPSEPAAPSAAAELRATPTSVVVHGVRLTLPFEMHDQEGGETGVDNNMAAKGLDGIRSGPCRVRHRPKCLAPCCSRNDYAGLPARLPPTAATARG